MGKEAERRKRRRLALATVQENLCAYCFAPMDPPNGSHCSYHRPDNLTLDEVIPQCLGGGLKRNTVAVHYRCNIRKANRPPTGCELLALEWVSAKLAADPDLGYPEG